MKKAKSSVIRHCAMAIFALGMASAAHAELACKESAGNRGTAQCDMTYRNTALNCKNGNIFPPCYKKNMPMKSFPKTTFKDVSAYVYAYPRDPKDKTLPYSGMMVRGQQGGPSDVYAPIGEAPKNVTKQQACVNQITMKTGSLEEDARLARLQLDNCANQYILNTALEPFYKENSSLLCATDADPSKRCGQADMCQPLRTLDDPKQEYKPSDYIKIAWEKMLANPKARKTKGANAEPHLPDGITLSKPIPVPNIPDIRLNQLAANNKASGTNYEEIIDPTHPFSPRWDFQWNERDHYSPLTDKYSTDTKNSVYCAGDRDKKIYKVDVLEFRRKPFDKETTNRINYNNACFDDKDTTSVNMTLPPYTMLTPTPEFVKMANNAYCYKIIAPPIPQTPVSPGYTGRAQRQPCWKCYGLSGKVSDTGNNQAPPCTTRYDGKDTKIKTPNVPGGMNSTSHLYLASSREAICRTPLTGKKATMKATCETLRAPYTPINKLKMRYYDPADKENSSPLKEGVQEGLWFKDYFYDTGNKMAHMPYPRLWDTGRSIQENDTSTQQDPNDIHGGFTAIVGVGREGATDAANSGKKDENKRVDQRCMYGGWGENASIGHVNITIPDPVTSWTELKLYQAYTTRETSIVCLGRYDKAFKYRSTENQMLLKSGALLTGVIQTRCDRDANGIIKSDTCKYTEMADFSQASGYAPNEKGKWENMQYVQNSWPLAWRGYISDENPSQRFPKLGGGGGQIEKGLDKAMCGDIILMPKGSSATGDKPGLPKLGRAKCYVNFAKPQKALRCESDGKHCYIDVEEADNGKWPDVCGTTDSRGELKTRRIFKPGNMRTEATDELKRIPWTGSCEDTKLAECEMKPWNELEVYHIHKDVQKGFVASDQPSMDADMPSGSAGGP